MALQEAYDTPDFENNEILAEKYMDRLFKFFPYSSSFEISDLINKTDFPPDEKIKFHLVEDIIINLLLNKFKYAEFDKDSTYYIHLNDKGNNVKNSGGHYAYLKKLTDKEFADNERQTRKDKSDEIDFKIKHWTYKARYTPFIFSGLALLGTVISIIISIKSLNYKKEQPDLKPLQQEIQELRDRMNKQDSLFLSDTLWKKHI